VSPEQGVDQAVPPETENEHPPPEVRRSHVARAQHRPLRIEPKRGQVPENGTESVVNKEPWHVLQEDESRFHVAKDADDSRPEPTVVILPLPLPGAAPRLTREARRDDIHDATPRAAVEGEQVIPDRSRIQGLVFHPRHEGGRRVGVPLNMTNGLVGRDGQVDSELEATNPGA
jgi:hypothetical protein